MCRRESDCKKLVSIAARVHPFPFRTRKLSSSVPKILGWKRPGKIGRCQHKIMSEKCTFHIMRVHFSLSHYLRQKFDRNKRELFSYNYIYALIAQSVEHAAVNCILAGALPAAEKARRGWRCGQKLPRSKRKATFGHRKSTCRRRRRKYENILE